MEEKCKIFAQNYVISTVNVLLKTVEGQLYKNNTQLIPALNDEIIKNVLIISFLNQKKYICLHY